MIKNTTFIKIRSIISKQIIITPTHHFWTFVGAFSGIGLIGWIQSYQFQSPENIFLIGSFGASAVLIYGVANSPLSQPRNLFGGHLISALIGVYVAQSFAFLDLPWFSCALAVSLSIVAMQVTKMVHPPGGATALIANLGSDQIKELGFYYILSPVLIGTFILFFIAILIRFVSKKF